MAETLIPPQDLDAEKSVLGALLLEKDAIISVAQFLKSKHFYNPAHAMLYEAILELFESTQSIDIITLSAILKKKKQLKKVGGRTYLTELVNFVPTAANISSYSQLVYDCYIRREIITSSGETLSLGYRQDMKLGDILNEAEKKLFSLSSETIKKSFVHIKDLLIASYDRAGDLEKSKDKMRGIQTGFIALDEVLGGMQNSNLVIIAARPSVGKTSLILDIARHASIIGKKKVGIFSLEMSNMELNDRLLSMQVGMNLWDYRMGKLSEDLLERVGDAYGELSEASIYIDDTPGQGMAEMRTKARRLHMEHGLDILMIDYLQLIIGRNPENRVQEVSEISRSLKNLARELDIPVIALSQLSRAVESRDKKIPQLSDLRESGCITGESLIYLSETGAYVQIKNLVGKKDFKVLSLNLLTWKFEENIVSNAFSTGYKAVYKIITKLGRIIRATVNHKFLTINGWNRLDRLSIGERIALHNEVEDKLILPKKTDLSRSRIRIGNSYCGHSLYKQNLSRERALGIGNVIKSAELNKLAQSNIYWDEIMSIEADGFEEVFDLTVEKNHNFIANNIIVHNSIEQDADVVIFIHREEQYNPETENKGIADLIIAKHRNGPTGLVRLGFIKEQTKYTNLDPYMSTLEEI